MVNRHCPHQSPPFIPADSSASSLVLLSELQWVWQKLPHAKERRTKDLLIGVIASALYYNSTLTISLLQQQNQLPAFLTTWGKVSLLPPLAVLLHSACLLCCPACNKMAKLVPNSAVSIWCVIANHDGVGRVSQKISCYMQGCWFLLALTAALRSCPQQLPLLD